MANLALERLAKTYRPRGRPPVTAVRDVDLDVGDGETVALLGSSGCGKTSILRMIAGFEDVTGGAVRISGQPVHRLPPAQRGVAMAFEGYALYPPLRVRDNIAFALLRERQPRAQVEARVRRIAELLEIDGILERYPGTIAAGQQQRTSLARALVRRAPVSLLDEPMSQLEPDLRALLRARIKDYLAEHRLTTVFVTHDQTEAMALADRIAVMEGGVLQQYAVPAELKERPANLFVAGFIGEPPMNLFDVAVEDRALVLPGAIRVSAPGLAADGTRRWRAGIRPHRIRIGTGGLTATVTFHSWLGDQTHVGLDLGGCPLVAVTDQALGLRVGATVPLALPPDALHLFEADSGRAVRHGLGGSA